MKNKKKKISTLQIARLLIQIAFFIFLPALYINTFSGIKQIYLSLLSSSFNFTAMLPELAEAIAIVPISLLLGRFFCGWMCAFGGLGDFIYHISSKVFKAKFRISEKTDRILKSFKYILLVFLIMMVWSFGIKTFSTSNPWDAFGMLATVGKLPDFGYVLQSLTPAFIIFMFIIIASFFVERFFCRYLCPLGAIFSIVSLPRLTRITKPRDKCGNCRICTNNCAMGISLYKKDVIASGECINCLKCVTACPRKNVSLTIAGSDIKPVLASGAVAVAAMTGIYYTGSVIGSHLNSNPMSNTVMAPTSGSSAASSQQAASQASSSSQGDGTSVANQTQQNKSSSQTQSPTATNKTYNDGVYEGIGYGFRGGTTTVSVTIKNDKISDISVKSYQDDYRFFSRAYTQVASEILSDQTSNVDAVSGATYSSRGIMQAVQSALSKAAVK